MTDIVSLIQSLSRPRLLIRAARHGLQDYSRDTTLSRLVGAAPGSTPHEVLPKLVEIESSLETARKEDDGAYSVARHVDVLIALIAESRQFLKPRAVDVS
ncbi:MAG: DUF6477 family protein [Pseudomonadota bacterium]